MPVEIKKIQQAYVFALDERPRQHRAFSSHAGGARFAFNWGLQEVGNALDAYKAEKDAGVEKPTTKIPSHFDLCKMWTAHKDDPTSELNWVGENFVGTYQAALRDAAVAWKNFFASRSGKRAGRRMGRPRFRSKHRSRRSFQVHGGTLGVVDAHHIKLPKIGVVKTHESTRKLLRRLANGTARLVRGTISQHSNGRWYIALTVEVDREIRTGPSKRQRAGGAIGIDIGVRNIVTLSTGASYEAPGLLRRKLRKLARAQQKVSRRQVGSQRRRKAQTQVGKLHHHIAEQRNRYSHRLSSALVHSTAAIAIEGFDIVDMAKGGSKDMPRYMRRMRNRSLYDAGLGNFRWQLQSKAAWYGCVVTTTQRHQETNRTCSTCGTVRTKPIPPHVQDFRGDCGHIIDRRLNTALVLARQARDALQNHNGAPTSEEPQNARGGGVRPAGASSPRGRPPMKREARTPRKRGDQPGTPGP